MDSVYGYFVYTRNGICTVYVIFCVYKERYMYGVYDILYLQGEIYLRYMCYFA